MSWHSTHLLSHLPVGYYVVSDGAQVWVQYRDEFGWAAPDWFQGDGYTDVCEQLEGLISSVWKGEPLSLPEPP